jgi:DNA-directed RNA polymerase specialized sigma24 family protein
VECESNTHEISSDGRPPQGSITALLTDLRRCDTVAFSVLWQRFFPRLTGLARRTLSALPRCGAEADDVAQSAFLSFWRALDQGQSLRLADRDDLWNLLAVVTVRKARKTVRSETARKRGGGRIQHLSAMEAIPGHAPPEGGMLLRMLSEITPPEFDLFCEEMLLKLDDESRPIAVLRLQGHSTSEIAKLVGQSPRSIQRSLEGTRALWRASADEN